MHSSHLSGRDAGVLAGRSGALASNPDSPVYVLSKIDLSRFRSLRLARRIAGAINDATSLENPLGSPRFRSPIVAVTVRLPGIGRSIGNGPSAVRITNR